ncbi:MAG: sigma-70 family RNA polymerase sigma factor [Kiritimatiellae bacterium]|nr:sigma-70 family RNA polymerase sigma factor [Kiritimatiellia bacterium]
MNYKPYRNESTRSSVLAGVAEGREAEAWARFFDTYAGYVFGIARRRGLAEADADEIVQQVMGELVNGNGLARYDRSRGGFRQWLARRVVWRVANQRRDGEARRAAEAEYAEGTAEAAEAELEGVFEEEWRAAVLGEALRRLGEESNPMHYAVFYASAVEGLDTETVRKMHGVGAANLYQIRRRLGARLRTLLEESRRDLESGKGLPGEG